MSELKDQRDYWNDRANNWDLREPLIPDEEELAFAAKYLDKDSDVLILGATPQLCDLALECEAGSVTSVDYAQNVIDKLRRPGVEYHCSDWSDFLDDTDRQYDTIMTDGGLLSLEFPDTWRRIARQMYDHIRPRGMFVARVYVNTEEPPKASYDNPNLERFVTSMGDVDANWMVHPRHPAFNEYDMEYTFPPEREVLRTLGQFALLEKMVPNYEEGQRFVSYAWQKPEHK